MHFLRFQPQHLRGDHRARGACAADVGRAGHHVGGAIGVDCDGGAGLKTRVEPEAGGQPAAHAAPFELRQRRFVVVGGDRGVQRLQITDLSELRTRGLSGAFLGAIDAPELERVDAQLLRQFVDDGLGAHSRVGRARSAVGRGLRLVDQHVVAVDPQILDVVRRNHRHAARADRRAGKAAGFVRHPDFGRGDLAVLVRAHLHLDVRARRWPGRLQHVRAAHDHLDRLARLLGQQQRERLQIDRNLPAEAAADLRGNHLDLAGRHVEDVRGLIPCGERPLRADPDRTLPVRTVLGDRVVRLDVALVDHRRIEFAFDHRLGRGKPGGQVPALELDVVGDVGVVPRAVFALAQSGNEDRGLVVHGLDHVLHVGQDFVGDLDQLDRLFGDVRAGGGHRGHDVAVVEHLVAGHAVARNMLRVDGQLAHHGGAGADVGHIVSSDDGLHPGQGRGRGGVDGLDGGVGVRTAQHLAVQQTGRVDVRAVFGPTGDLVDAVVADRARADDFELVFLRGCHVYLPCISAAASCTALTILS